MKENDYIGRKERKLLAVLGKGFLWKVSRLLVGIIPMVGATVMFLHCCLLSLGYRSRLTEWIYDCSLFGFVGVDNSLTRLWLLLGASGIHNIRRGGVILHRLPTYCWFRSVAPAAPSADGRHRCFPSLRLRQVEGLE